MKPTPRLLLIDDDTSLASSLGEALTAENFEVETIADARKGLARLGEGAFDIVLSDIRMPGMDGLELVARIRAAKPWLPVVLHTAYGTAETAIEATKRGAYDYLLKPYEIEDLTHILRQALEQTQGLSKRIQLGVPAAVGETTLVGHCPAMQQVFKEIGRVAARPVTVIIRGETGTGKEMVARAIYQHSERANAAFLAVNCAAIPETLLESELFGHERGAFTGADTRRIGRFEQASGGTLFLDEIGDISLSTQAKLLRVLQEKTIQRLGGRETVSVDVRVIAATHRNLDEAVRLQQFREDLFYRLNVGVISLPPLRERLEDMAELVTHFLSLHSHEMGQPNLKLPTAGLDLLKAHSWPGNVRELQNVIRKLLLAANGFAITPEQVRTILATARTTASNQPESNNSSFAARAASYIDEAVRGERENAYEAFIHEAEQLLLRRAMTAAQGNQSRAARWLGISRFTLREKLRQHNLHPTEED